MVPNHPAESRLASIRAPAWLRRTLLGVWIVWLVACSSDLSPASTVLATAFTIAGHEHHDLSIDASATAPLLITIRSSDIDVRIAIATPDDSESPTCDAPNQRMGVETLLLVPAAAHHYVLQITGNDNGQAHGTVAINAVQLPVATEADQMRLKAARLEGRACFDYSDIQKAQAVAAAYAEAAELYRRAGADAQAGIAYLQAAGTHYVRLADWEGAADIAARAARQLTIAEEPLLATFAVRLQGAALNEFAESTAVDADTSEQLRQDARALLTTAAHRFIQLDAPYQAAYAFNYRGVSFHAAGDRKLARRDYQRALELFRTSGDRPAQALSLQSLAHLDYDDGRLAESIRSFDEALALIPLEDEPESYAHTLHNSALPLRVLGRLDEALDRFHRAGEILRAHGDQIGEARALHGIGTTFRYAGDARRAKEYLRAAIELRSNNVARREQAVSLIVLGEIERDQGHLVEAAALHERAAELVSAPNDRAKALIVLAQDHLASGDLVAAREALDSLFQLGLPKSHRHLGMALTELGSLASRQGDRSAATSAFERAIAIQRANGSDFELAGTLVRRAEFMMEIGDTNAAIADSASALHLFEQIGQLSSHAESRATLWASYRSAVEVQIAALVAAADVLQRSGNLASAQPQLRAAFATSDRFRARLLTQSGSMAPSDRSVSADQLKQQRRIQDLLVGKRHRQAQLLDSANPDAQELVLVRREIAWLRSEARQLEQTTAAGQQAQSELSTINGNELVRMVPDGVLVAEFFLGQRHSWLFEVRDHRVAVHVLAANAQLEPLARQLHESWSVAGAASDVRVTTGQRLAQLVLGPLDDLASTNSVLIIPDGALHLVPIVTLMQQLHAEAMPDSTVIVPSLLAVLSSGIRPAAVSAPRVVVIADPVYSSDDPRIRTPIIDPVPSLAKSREVSAVPLTTQAVDLGGLRRLPATGVEARAIRAFESNSAGLSVLEGLDATRSNVVKHLSDSYQIVHFATHAVADSEDPGLATIALSQWSADGVPQDGALRQAEITQMRILADLVVLGACDTALGREVTGEGMIGLSNAFLRAGARSVLSTLWQVPDSSTAVLMREFYSELLQNGQTASVALWRAQSKVRSTKRWSDPYYWAGFQLVTLRP